MLYPNLNLKPKQSVNRDLMAFSLWVDIEMNRPGFYRDTRVMFSARTSS